MASVYKETVEPGNGHDVRGEPVTEGTWQQRMEAALLEIHGMVHRVSTTQEVHGRALIRLTTDLDLVRKAQQQSNLRDSLPPMRPKLDSVSSLDEERTNGGTLKYTGTHEQMERIADARAEAKYRQLQETERLASAAAPILFIKGSVPGTIRAILPMALLAIGAGILETIKWVWSKLHP